MVKVERRYLFAGENLTYVSIHVAQIPNRDFGCDREVIEVPENSAEAKKWPLWRPPGCEVSPTSASPDLLQVSSEPNVATPITPVAPTSGKRPGPRKPRTSLPSLPSQKAKKLSTLDKSAMDWRAHINAEQEKSGLKDELEAHRRGGGYLGKVDFLRRVDERKEGAIEANKSSKRRRP
jgi:hypothetical protein